MKKYTLFIACFFSVNFLFSQLPVDQNGWTVLTPSIDTRMIYVSSSQGNDLNSGDMQHPLQTIQAAYNMLRDGFPDWILLKNGDVWTTGLGEFSSDGHSTLFRKNGRSATEPIVVASYGDCGDRPLLKTDSVYGVYIYRDRDGGKIQNIVVSGIEFYSSIRNPNDLDYIVATIGDTTATDGFKVNYDAENILIEDCKFSYYGGCTFDASELPNQVLKQTNMKLRRSIIAYNYSATSHAQGLFLNGTEGTLIEENIFHHNGWNENISNAEATIYNHNMYITGGIDPITQQPANKNVIVKGNIISKAASHGLQMRPGGIVENNLFLENPIAMMIKQDTSMVKKNVFLNSAPFINYDKPRGFGLEIMPCRKIEVENNIFANQEVDAGGYAIAIDRFMYQDGAYNYGQHVIQPNLLLQKNVVHNWSGSALKLMDTTYTPSQTSGMFPKDWDQVKIQKNTFNDHVWNSRLVNAQRSRIRSNYIFSDNNYFSNRNANEWFLEEDDSPFFFQEYNFNSWSSLLEAIAAIWTPPFIDPNRTISTYNASLGGANSSADFMEQALQQSKCNWRNEYTANSANDYIRKGFCKTFDLPKAAFSFSFNGTQISFNDSSINANKWHWDFGDGNTSGLQNPTHLFSSLGLYNISLIVSNECGSDTLVLLSLDIKENNLQSAGIGYYPNPVKDVLNIYSKQSIQENISISLLNSVGQSVMQKQASGLFANESIQLPIHEMAKGIYIIRIDKKDKSFFDKVIIE